MNTRLNKMLLTTMKRRLVFSSMEFSSQLSAILDLIPPEKRNVRKKFRFSLCLGKNKLGEKRGGEEGSKFNDV